MTMLGRAGVVLVAMAAALAVLSGPATAGNAHNRYIGDAKRDWSFHKNRFGPKEKAATDLTRVHYWTTKHRFKVRFKVRKLRRHVRKPQLMLEINRNAAGGPAVEWEPGARPDLYDNGVTSCKKHSTERTSYAHNYIEITFPKRCFVKGHTYPQPWAEATMPRKVNGQTIYLVDVTDYGRGIKIRP